MVVRHNLPVLMAKNRIKSIKELERIMKKYEYSTLINFNTYVHKKLDPELVADLCELFRCKIGDLLYLEDKPMREGVK
jgi:DNA-binding Xre family transcriptional regulator